MLPKTTIERLESFKMPGFIDAHGHITGLAQQADLAALQPPPVGTVSDIASLQAALRQYAQTHADGWLMGMGYGV